MADRQIEGSIEVVDPAGDTTLEKTFDLEHEQDQHNGSVFRDVGGYAVSVELTSTEITGSSQASETVSIDDTAEERVGVVFTTNERDEPILIRVGATPKDFLDVATWGWSLPGARRHRGRQAPVHSYTESVSECIGQRTATR